MTDKETTNAHLPDPSPVEHGGRVELRLLQTPTSDSPQALYHARWFTADDGIEGEVRITPADVPQIELKPAEELPEWLGSFTTTLVRTTARQAQKENTWPRRLTRWRATPKAKSPAT